jgi:chromosome segregation ATPase
MNASATKEDIKGLEVQIEKAVVDLSEIISNFAQQVDGRFNKLEQEVMELRESHTRLLNTIDGFIGRIDKYETELAARDNQLEKLLIWARKVSEKTGIPLENL